MSRRTRRDERGSAIVEFVFLSVVLLIPLVYLVLCLGRLQAGSYAVSAAAREAGRAFVTSEASDSATGRAESAAAIAFEDQGFGGDGGIEVSCSATPCLTPEASVSMAMGTVISPSKPVGITSSRGRTAPFGRTA